ncbi:MAG: transglutaminase-like domain-containing protein [Sedimenticola sp.]|nr:transglutaminase-like domain-containing protein [Sedimenticola sp.]
MSQVSVSIEEGLAPERAWLLLPRPIDDWTQHFLGIELEAVQRVHELAARNSRQMAYLVQPAAGKVPRIRYTVGMAKEPPPKWIWEMEENRYTRASGELAALAAEMATGTGSQRQTMQRLVEHTAGLFGYDHPEQRFNHGLDEVPAICGTARGSCVDINTYLIAATRSLDIPVQYLAGYWFHPQRRETLDMHCWLALRLDDEVCFWDLAHHLKWGVERLAPGLNPASGRRVTMSCGRGLRFDTPHGPVTLSHFSEPLWVLPDGTTRKPQLRIHINEQDGSDKVQP